MQIYNCVYLYGLNNMETSTGIFLIMSSIYTFVEYIQEPAFLVDVEQDKVVHMNEMAKASLDCLLDKPYSSIFSPVKSLLSTNLYTYKHKMYVLQKTTVHDTEKEYILVIVQEQLPSDRLPAMAEELAGLLVHTFRSPLSGILGFTDLMKNQGDENQQRYATSIEGGLLKMTRILDEVEELGNINEPNITSFKPEALLVDLLLDFPKDQQDHIEVSIEERGTSIESDYVLVRAILNELISNALQFGGTDTKPVQISYKGNGLFSVTNFGEPIVEENLSKIFYPFFSSKGSNTGLGLTKASIYAHVINATFSLTSNTDESVCFELRV